MIGQADLEAAVTEVKPSLDVGAYGQNVDVAVRSLIGQIIYLATLATPVLVLVTNNTPYPRPLAVFGFTGIALLGAVLTAVRFRAMPPAGRPLLRSRRVTLAVGVVYGAILIAIIIAGWLGQS
jgi:hypothetical protein